MWKTHAQRRAMIDRIEEQRERDPLRPALWRRLAELHMLDGRPSDSRLLEENVRRLLRSARKWRDERGATFDERELAELVVG